VLLAYGVAYFFWRATCTLNFDNLFLSVVCVFGDGLSLLTSFLFLFETWGLDTEFPFSLPQGRRVDVFVATYNESADIVEATLTGCNLLTYPHVTYVLDDGRRPEIKALAARMGCRYLTRSDNLHSKAGNINAALPRTSGEFVLTLDADMVPQPDLLEKALGYFVDSRVAIVQFPQEFYNLNSLQHFEATKIGGKTWQEQDFFYRLILQGRNRWSGAFWCGCPSVVRREALVSVGGVSTRSSTEDFHTSIILNTKGWKIIASPETVAFGLAPQTLESFLIQRYRWCEGSIQAFRSSENPFIARGLSLPQRACIFASEYHYLIMPWHVVTLVLPALIFVSGKLPISTDFRLFIALWLPWFVSSFAMMKWKSKGRYRIIPMEILNCLQAFALPVAVLSGLSGKRIKFKVTPKEVDVDTALRSDFRALRPLAVLLGVLTSVFVAASLLATKHLRTSNDWRFFYFGMLWLLFRLVVLIKAVRFVQGLNHSDRSYRFPAVLNVRIGTISGPLFPGTTVNINHLGMRIESASEPVSGVVRVQIELPNARISSRGTLVWKRFEPQKNKWVSGLALDSLPEHDRAELMRFLYVLLPTRWSTKADPAVFSRHGHGDESEPDVHSLGLDKKINVG